MPQAHGLGDQGTASGAEQKPDTPQNQQKRHDEIHSGKGRLSYKIGDKKAVHHSIDRGKYQHDDGRKGIAQKARIRKMVGKANHRLLFRPAAHGAGLYALYQMQNLWAALPGGSSQLGGSLPQGQ